ncbi:MAG: PEP-CTERM sorting domain-containing protein [Desulfarculaceae bacterium]
MSLLLMKRCAVLVSIIMMLFGWGGAALASQIDVFLYVDTAPNLYGSPDYPTWEADAFAKAAGGTFVNMANSIDPMNIGTTDFMIEDEVVYSFGDLGNRRHWLFWIPGETVESLTEAGIEVSLFNTWDGVTTDFYLDYYGETWRTPNLQNYNGGVIGMNGMAWWGAYQVNTQEALDADIAAWRTASETWEYRVRFNKLEQEISSIMSQRQAIVTPEPATIILLGSGLLGLAAWRRRRFR